MISFIPGPSSSSHSKEPNPLFSLWFRHQSSDQLTKTLEAPFERKGNTHPDSHQPTWIGRWFPRFCQNAESVGNLLLLFSFYRGAACFLFASKIERRVFCNCAYWRRCAIIPRVVQPNTLFLVSDVFIDLVLCKLSSLRFGSSAKQKC